MRRPENVFAARAGPKRADSAEARFTKAEKDLAEARAELTLAETRGAEKA